MSYAQGIDFRATAGFVADPANCTAETGAAANYPRATPQGNMVGWETVATAIAMRDRNAGVDARLAGIHSSSNTAGQNVYRMDVPAGANVDIALALGDAGSGQTGQSCAIYDGATLLATVVANGTTAQSHFYDATGVQRVSVADWVANNVAANVTVASGILRFKFGGGSSGAATSIAHIFVQEAAASGVALAARMGARLSGRTATDPASALAAHGFSRGGAGAHPALSATLFARGFAALRGAAVRTAAVRLGARVRSALGAFAGLAERPAHLAVNPHWLLGAKSRRRASAPGMRIRMRRPGPRLRSILSGSNDMDRFDPKTPAETIIVSFDFADLIAEPGLTIASTAVAAAIYAQGTVPDPDPAAILSGAASLSGTVVSQLVTGGIGGVDYAVTATVTLSDGEILAAGAILPVRDLP